MASAASIESLPNRFLDIINHSLQQTLRFVEFPLRGVERSKSAADVRSTQQIRRILGGQAVQNFEGAAQRFFGLLIGAEPEVKQPQITEARRQVGMRLLAIELLTDLSMPFSSAARLHGRRRGTAIAAKACSSRSRSLPFPGRGPPQKYPKPHEYEAIASPPWPCACCASAIPARSNPTSFDCGPGSTLNIASACRKASIAFACWPAMA